MAAAVTTSYALAQSNLLLNGSFESSTFSGSPSEQIIAPAGPANVPSWVWSPSPGGGYTALVNHLYGPQHGSLCLAVGFGSANGGGTLSQSFTATAGATHRVSLWVKRLGNPATLTAAIQIQDAGGMVVASANASSITTSWQEVAFNFVAPSSNLKFVFVDTTAAGTAGSSDILLDNVMVEQLPTIVFRDVRSQYAYQGSESRDTLLGIINGSSPVYFHQSLNSAGWLNTWNGVTDHGYHLQVRFEVSSAQAGAWHFRFGSDFGRGGAIFVDGVKVASRTDDLWWAGDWNHPAVMHATGVNLSPGLHTVDVFGFEACCGGPSAMQFQIGNTGWRDVTVPNLSLQSPPVITSATSATGTYGSSFSYTITATNSPTAFNVSYLPPGLGFNSSMGVIYGTPAQAGTFNIGLYAANSAGTGTANLNLSINKAPAGVMLGSLNHTYDGTVKSATATTSPSGLPVNFSYTGASLPPLNAGSYGVLGAINHSNYVGSASGTMVISPAPATITLSNLAHSYDGTPKAATATTSPPGLGVSLTYNGSTVAPAALGSYNVAATIINPNYTGSASGTITIRDLTPPVLTLPGNITVEATGPNGAVVTFAVSAKDDLSGNVGVIVSQPSGSTFPLGNTTVTIKATDNAGNTATGSFIVTVRDTTKPTLSVPSDITAEATSASGAIVNFASTVNDTVGVGVFSSGFETPVRSTNSYTYLPDGSVSGEWRSKYPAGIINGSRPDWRPDTAPSGAQYAFIQINQSLGLVGGLETDKSYALVAGQPYTLIFYQSSRPQVFNPGIGGAVTYTVTLNSGAGSTEIFRRTTTTAEGWKRYTIHFTPSTSGNYRLAFNAIGQGTSDDTVFLDDVVLLTSSGAATTSPVSGSVFPIGTTTVAVTGADASGNVQSGSFRVTVADTTAPTITAPANMIVEATSAAGAVATFSASATDAVSGNVAVSASPASGSTFPLGTTTVTLTAKDAANNTATKTFTVTVRDTIAPVLTVPANQVLEATGPTGAVATFAATATDAVGATLSYSKASGSTFPLGTTTVTVTASDAAGNKTTGAFSITVRDTTKPVLTLPTNLSLEATSAAGAVATFSASASDIVSGAVPVTLSPVSGSTFALGTTTVNATATDAAGNTASGAFTVTVVDTTAPVITAPADITTEATSASGAAVTFSASASDLVSGAVSVSASPASGSTFALGTTTVTLTAKDAAGNTATKTFSVKVQDTTAPTIAPQGDIVIEATGPAGAMVTFAPTATDLVSGNVAVTSSVASGSTFALGNTPVTLTAKDAAGNTATKTFVVTVHDTTAPVIAAQDNLIVEATSAAGAVATFTPSATDIVSGAVTVVAAPASGSTFPLGDSTVTLTAKDAAGNTASSTFTVTVRDTTAPSISSPGNLTAEATSAAGAAVSFSASATDAVSGSVAVTASPSSGSTFPLGTTTVTLTSTDQAGNTATTSFTVTVRDTTPPVVKVPASQTLEATGPDGAAASFTATATDAVGATLSYSHAPGSTFPLGTTTVTVTAKDAAGNSSQGTFSITVQDTTKPALTLPASLTVEATSAAGAVATFSASASDVVSGVVAVTLTPDSGSTFALGTTTVNATAADAAGNTATGSFTVTVQDTTPPVLTTPANQTLEATSAAGAVATFAASATDAVGATITYSHGSGDTFALGTTTITVTAADAAGNTSTGTFTITVQDTTKPTLTLPANVTLEATSAAGAVATFATSANDIVDGAVATTASPASGSTFALGTTTVTVTATDAAGNTATGTFTVTVEDTTPPALTTPVSQTLEATGPNGAAATFAATATDAVGATVSYSDAPGSVFPLGTTTVTVTAADAAGNSTKGTFSITVEDTTKPVLSLPADLVVEASSAAGAVATFSASASDIVSGTLPVSFSHASGSTFPIATTTVTATAVDKAGNTVTGTFNVTVRDTIAPVLTVPANQVLEATSGAGAVATFAASATDAVGATLSYTHASGSTFPLGTTTVEVTATDAAGNATSGTFTITVRDTTAPVITSLTPSTTTLWPVNHKMVAVTIKAATTDAVSAVTTKIVSVTSNEPINGKGDGNTQPDWEITGPMSLNLRAERAGAGSDRVYTITVEAKDEAGNVSTRTTTVTVPKSQGGK